MRSITNRVNKIFKIIINRLLFLILMTVFVFLPFEPNTYALVGLSKVAEASKEEVLIAQRRSGGSNRQRSLGGQELEQALTLVRNQNYQEAAPLLFQLTMNPRFARQRLQIRYVLGQTLHRLDLYQLAAFQYISVVRAGNSRYLQPALENLSVVADVLGDDTLLNYAISRVRAESFPAAHKSMLFFRIGEFQFRGQQYRDAIRSFNQVDRNSSFFDRAAYLRALSFAHLGDTARALQHYDRLIEARSGADVTDVSRVAALMGKARVHYQAKNWSEAIETYRRVPKDSHLWHDTLFESSWAMLQSGKFRSALSQFHSLHSPYYEQAYIPESLLLRSIVYLYICQYDEMEKVLNLFNRLYRPIFNTLTEYLRENQNPNQYFNDIVRAIQESEKEGFDPEKSNLPIPYLLSRRVASEGDFQRSMDYIKRLLEERRRISEMPAEWRGSALGTYAAQTLERRTQRARARGGRQARAHLVFLRSELIDFFEQEGFIRFEMLSGKREQVQKRIAGRELPRTQIDEDQTRDFYIQNGYQYWTFRGEYWLDELGNYHYVGTQSCE